METKQGNTYTMSNRVVNHQKHISCALCPFLLQVFTMTDLPYRVYIRVVFISVYVHQLTGSYSQLFLILSSFPVAACVLLVTTFLLQRFECVLKYKVEHSQHSSIHEYCSDSQNLQLFLLTLLDILNVYVANFTYFHITLT